METKSKKPMSATRYGLLWSTRALSGDIGIALFAYTSFYVTDILGLPPARIGMILLGSKVIDGLVDLFYGILIDRTKSRLGKGRPYELALIGYWASGILIFATPHTTVTLMLFYFFFMYNMRQSVFQSLLACAEPVYFVNSIPDKSQAAKILSIRGTVCGIGTLPFSVLLPQAIRWAGEIQQRWILIGLTVAIPFTLIGLLRFFFIKETQQVAMLDSKLSFRESMRLIAKNKYLCIYVLALFLTYISYHLSSESAVYYAKYVLGDVGVTSWLTLSGLSALLATILIPWGAKKWGLNGYVKRLMILSVIGNLLRLINPYSAIVQFAAGLFALCSILPFWGLISAYLMECMDYGEWKTGIRVEGVYSSLANMVANIGTGIGMAAVGLILAAFGYNAALAVQPDSAKYALMGTASILPTILGIIVVIILHRYDLGQQLPGIRADLEKRKTTV